MHREPMMTPIRHPLASARRPELPTPSRKSVTASASQHTPRTRRGGVRIAASPTQSLVKRLLSLPQDLYERYEIQAHETISIWKTEVTQYAARCAVASWALQILCRCGAGLFATDRTRAMLEMDRRVEAIRSTIGIENRIQQSWPLFLTVLLSWMLVCTSVINAVWLFHQQRSYSLFMSPVDQTINSPGAKLRKVNQQPSQSGTSRPLWRRLLTNIFEQMAEVGSTDALRVHTLSIWTPHDFNLVYFAWFSPPVAVLTQFAAVEMIYKWIVTIVLVEWQICFLVHLADQTLRDRRLMQAQVMGEYDAKFVNPRINYPRRDASTSTSDDSDIARQHRR